MKPRKAVFLLHRWVGLVIALQLLAWSVGGFTFSILNLDNVHGDTDARMIDYLPLSAQTLETLPQPVRAAIESLGASDTDERVSGEGVGGVAQIALVDRGLGPFWEVRDAHSRLLARIRTDGHITGQITKDQAEQIARGDFKPKDEAKNTVVIRSQLIEGDAPSEYREKSLPAYQVVLGHEKQIHVYVDAQTGRITARRNRAWRAFDFFWMLHTMDYNGRDNFNHWLLTGASLLAIFTAATGISLWGWRAKGKIARRRRNKRLWEEMEK